jgi:hypothetical protein
MDPPGWPIRLGCFWKFPSSAHGLISAQTPLKDGAAVPGFFFSELRRGRSSAAVALRRRQLQLTPASERRCEGACGTPVRSHSTSFTPANASVWAAPDLRIFGLPAGRRCCDCLVLSWTNLINLNNPRRWH